MKSNKNKQQQNVGRRRGYMVGRNTTARSDVRTLTQPLKNLNRNHLAKERGWERGAQINQLPRAAPGQVDCH